MSPKTGEPWITHLHTEDGTESWDHYDGMPGVDLFSNAIQVWARAQNRDRVTVAEAALAFNVAPEIIRQAVESHYWMFLDGDVIEHEGE